MSPRLDRVGRGGAGGVLLALSRKLAVMLKRGAMVFPFLSLRASSPKARSTRGGYGLVTWGLLVWQQQYMDRTVRSIGSGARSFSVLFGRGCVPPLPLSLPCPEFGGWGGGEREYR